MIALFAGSIRRSCRRRVTAAICAIDPASATPVGPHRPRADRYGIGQGPETWGIGRKLVIAEIARLSARRDDETVERDFADADPGGGRIDRSSLQVHADHFGEQYTGVFCILARCRSGAEISDGSKIAVAT